MRVTGRLIASYRRSHLFLTHVTHRFLSIAGGRANDTAENHEEIFVGRYRRLLALARRVAGGHQEVAEDLLHDAYVQFVISRPDLTQIADLDAYLSTLIRNLYVSSQRRKANQHHVHVGLEEYDSAERALERFGPHQRAVAREGLGHICAHVCRRKETSKGASVLILRFFHGFYPTEIERILRAPGRTVSRLLARARAEARVVLADPTRLPSVVVPALNAVVLPAHTSEDAQTLAALRAAIFDASVPPCPEPEVIRRWYAGARLAIGTGTLAHIVSCRTCLARVCATLGLPPLDERSPTDPPSGPDPEGPGSRASTAPLRKAKRRGVPDVLEHRPKELQISVNGLSVGLLRVTSAENRVRWTVRLDEPLAFVELHSEQDVRMLLLNLSPPTEGTLMQRARVALSADRWLDLAVDFSELHPAVTVEYVDPSLTAVEGRLVETGTAALPASAVADPVRRRPSLWSRLARVWQWPARLVPTSLAIAAVAGSVWWMTATRVSPPDASTVLTQAVAAEARIVLPSDQATHLTVRLVIRPLDAAQADTDYRVETWSLGGSVTRAVRMLDANGHVVAGKWTDADQRTTALGLGDWDEVWQAGLSATVFQDRYAAIGPCVTTDEAALQTIVCERPLTTGLLHAVAPIVHAQTSLIEPRRAALTLRRRDLHPVRLAVTLRADGVERVVTLEEEALERVPASAIPADVFAPPAGRAPSAAAPSTIPSATPRPDVTPSLELRLVELVDRLPGSEYLSVGRRNTRGLTVTGLVRDHRDRRALLDAITSLDATGAIAADVRTFAEAAARPPRSRNEVTRMEARDAPGGPAPVEQYLRGRVPPDTDVAALARELAPRVLGDARRARQSAVALETLLTQFEHLLGRLDDQGRAAWRALVARRIADAGAALETVDAGLGPYFERGQTSPLAAAPDLPAAIRRLAQETLTVENAVTTAFTASDPSLAASDRAVAVDVRQHVQQAQDAVHQIQTFIQR